jgi:hypothetical protein
MLVTVDRGRKRTISGFLSTRLVTATSAVVSAVVAIHNFGGSVACCGDVKVGGACEPKV